MNSVGSSLLRALACIGAWLAVPGVAQAGTELIAGWEGSESRGYAFVSPVFNFRSDGEWSWVARGSVSHLHYDFTEAGDSIRVRSPGQAVGVGLRYAGPRLSATFGPGYEIRQTTRRSSSGETKETERGATVQAELFYQATPRTNLSFLAAYGDANEYFWTRAGLKRQLTNLDYSGNTALHLGIELTSQGNDDGDANQIGGVFEVAFPKSRASLQFRVGYSRISNPDSSEQSDPYFGLGFYRGF